jgi:hypothetical protein
MAMSFEQKLAVWRQLIDAEQPANAGNPQSMLF